MAFTLSRAGPKCNTPKENLLDAIENNNIKEIKSVLQNLNKSKKWILFEYIILMKKKMDIIHFIWLFVIILKSLNYN